MHEVALLALDGQLDSGLAITLDVIFAANAISAAVGRPPPFHVRVLSTRRSGVVTGSGYRRSVDGVFGPGELPGVVVIPGVQAPRPEEIDALLARDDVKKALRWLKLAHEGGARILASCSATFLLGQAGLLDGGSATTSWYLAADFHRRFPAVDLRQDAMVVESGSIVTAGAAFAHVDLMLWLVRHLAGPGLADRCARVLVIDDRPTQARYLGLQHLRVRSGEVGRAERFLRENLGRTVTLPEIARAAKTSPRTLARRFEESMGMSPLRFLRRLRVERAQQLLEMTRSSVEEVARLVGYADPIALRRLLQKELGRSAREIRSRAPAAKRLQSSPPRRKLS